VVDDANDARMRDSRERSNLAPNAFEPARGGNPDRLERHMPLGYFMHGMVNDPVRPHPEGSHDLIWAHQTGQRRHACPRPLLGLGIVIAVCYRVKAMARRQWRTKCGATRPRPGAGGSCFASVSHVASPSPKRGIRVPLRVQTMAKGSTRWRGLHVSSART